MILILQGLSLLLQLIVESFRVVFSLPRILLSNLVALIFPRPLQNHPGCVFYVGNVVHHRRKPVEHRFTYPLRLALINLDNAPDWFQTQSKDHWSADECRKKAGTQGEVHLLTNPMSCNYLQNPISVYCCFSSSGVLEKCIAEVTNTPWGARVQFLFDPSGEKVSKALHVSPLMDMDAEWILQARMTSEDLSLTVRCRHQTLGDFFDAILHLKKSEGPHNPNESNGFKTLWKYGFLPHRVAVWIYWNVICLLTKGVRVYGYPDSKEVRPKAEKDSSNLKFTTGEKFIWTDPKSCPWNSYT